MDNFTPEEIELVRMYRSMSKGLKTAVLDIIKHISETTKEESRNDLPKMQ